MSTPTIRHPNFQTVCRVLEDDGGGGKRLYQNIKVLARGYRCTPRGESWLRGVEWCVLAAREGKGRGGD